jgi:acetylglutamate kinase
LFEGGLRVTTEEVLDVVMMSLAGKVNKLIVKDFNDCGDLALGISGVDASLFRAEKLLSVTNIDLGFVGTPVSINIEAYKKLLSLQMTLVIATLGVSDCGILNINADHTAAFLAQQVQAEHLLFVSDVDGVLDPETSKTIPNINRAGFETLKAKGHITEGMIPKLCSCLDAVENGVKQVTIVNGRREGALFQTIVSQKNLGTIIT